jgi:hypothetical protein
MVVKPALIPPSPPALPTSTPLWQLMTPPVRILCNARTIIPPRDNSSWVDNEFDYQSHVSSDDETPVKFKGQVTKPISGSVRIHDLAGIREHRRARSHENPGMGGDLVGEAVQGMRLPDGWERNRVIREKMKRKTIGFDTWLENYEKRKQAKLETEGLANQGGSV